MKINKIKFLIAVIMAILITANLSLAREIVVGTSSVIPPYMSIDTKTNKLVGYEADITEAIMKRAGHTVKWVDMQFDGLIPSLISGKIEVIGSALSVTEERKKKIDYSDPYNAIGSKITILTSVKDINTMTDLKNKNVGVVVGTVEAIIAQKNAKSIGKITQFNGNDELLLALVTKKVDAIIENEVSISYALKTGQVKDIKSVGKSLDRMDMAFGLRKGNKKLLDEINKSLKELKDSGEYDKIHKKWFTI
jgi:polar amino acid transport system substrate-binding protein